MTTGDIRTAAGAGTAGTVEVRPATGADRRALAATLARAFDADPLMAWMLPDAAARRARLPRLFAALLRWEHLPYGGCELALGPGGVLGGTAWDPPGRTQPSPLRRYLSVPAFVRAMGDRVAYGARMTEAFARARPAEPHWYLALVGTEAAARGRGVGGRLLRSRLDRCDAEGVPAYLENSNEANLGFYQAHGFRVTGRIALPDDGPPIWAMWREPGAGTRPARSA